MPKIKVKGQTGERPQTNGHTRTHTDATKRIISPATRLIKMFQNYFSWPAQRVPSSYTAGPWNIRCRNQWNMNHKLSAMHNGSRLFNNPTLTKKWRLPESEHQSTYLVTSTEQAMKLAQFAIILCSLSLSVCSIIQMLWLKFQVTLRTGFST